MWGINCKIGFMGRLDKNKKRAGNVARSLKARHKNGENPRFTFVNEGFEPFL
jgi:hypothetical protein